MELQPASLEADADRGSATGLQHGRGATVSHDRDSSLGSIPTGAIAVSHGRDSSSSIPTGVPTRVLVLAACAALNSCNLGFDIGVNTAVGPTLQEGMHLSDQQLELFSEWATVMFSLLLVAFARCKALPFGLKGPR